MPTVSIGMPVFNGERTLRSAVESLLAQTFGDFELVISDNASTDGSWRLIEELAADDARIRGIRQPSNIGANANYSAVFLASRGRYFKWASSNDWCAPTLLQRCVEQLERDPGVVLVAPHTRLFETDPRQSSAYDGDIACLQADPVERFVHVGSRLALNNVVNGVVRSDAMRRTRLVEHYPGADVVLVAHLALQGRVLLVDEALFYRRMDRATATRMMSQLAVHRHHYPVDTWRSALPAWRLAAGWMRAVLSTPLSIGATLRALGWVARSTWWDRAQLGRDLVDLLRHRRQPPARNERC